MGLLIPGAENRQLKAVLMWPPPNPQMVLDSRASYLFDPQLFSAQVGWVAVLKTVLAVIASSCMDLISAWSQLPRAVADDTMKYNEWTCGN